MQQVLQTKSADEGQQKEKSGGTGRGDANHDSGGAGRAPREEGAAGASVAPQNQLLPDEECSIPAAECRMDQDLLNTRAGAEVPAGVSPMINMQPGETRD